MNAFNSIDTAEEKISEMKDKLGKKSRLNHQRQRMEKTEKSVKDIWNIVEGSYELSH